jgi:hypothetical protein
MPATSLYGASLGDVFCVRVDTLFLFECSNLAKHRLQKNKMTKLALIGSVLKVFFFGINVFSLGREFQELLAEREEIVNNHRGIEQLRELRDNLNARSKDFEQMRARNLGVGHIA